MNQLRPPHQRQAAIAVIVREQKLLVIERSQTVRAPGKFCFPGGEVEKGEHVAETVVRELFEEMGLKIQPIRQLWTSTAPSGCVLNWIHSRIVVGSRPQPNLKEVSSWSWMTEQELAEHPDALPSNLEFLRACSSGLFKLPQK